MNYPFWDIPHIGSGWVIGMIAIFHVMISQFAVGGGFYLPMAERKAMRDDRCARARRLAQTACQPLEILPRFSRRSSGPYPAWASGSPSG